MGVRNKFELTKKKGLITVSHKDVFNKRRKNSLFDVLYSNGPIYLSVFCIPYMHTLSVRQSKSPLTMV